MGDEERGALSESERRTIVDSLTAELQLKLSQAQSLKDELDSLLIGARSKAEEVNGIATQALAARTQVTDAQAVVAAKSVHIQDAQEHAGRVRTEIDRLQTVVTQLATEAEGQKARAQAATDSVAELQSEVRALRASAEADATATTAHRDAAVAASEVAKGLAERAATTEARLKDYEARLAGLEGQAKERLATITNLLPGATAAGLAHAFDDRRKTFLNPSRRWQWVFVGSVVTIVVLAASGLWHVYMTGLPLAWDELARLWVARLPIAGALIWLALHASRESALAKRLEEDYGYKAAIASSFLGFQKQMAEIGSDAGEGSPLAQLCTDTLATIASPPGRIYDKHKLTVTPSSEAADAASRLLRGEQDKK